MLAKYAVGGPRTKWSDIKGALPVPKDPRRMGYPPHANARWARRNLGAKRYDQAFSFALVRNPYDRAVSRYEYVRQNANHHNNAKFQNMTFEEFVDDEKLRNRLISRTQFSEVSDRAGRVIVSKIYRFEAITDAILDICERLDTPKPDVVPHQNSSRRQSYQTYFTPAIRAKFEDIYAQDIAFFEYSF